MNLDAQSNGDKSKLRINDILFGIPSAKRVSNILGSL